MTERMTVAEFATEQWLTISEADFQKWLVALCRRHGVLVHHARPAPTRSGGYATPIQGSAGFPDVVLAKKGRPTHIWELKSEKGRLSAAQQAWVEAMGVPRAAVKPSMAGIWWPHGRGPTVGVVRPSMRDEIEAEVTA